MKRLGEVCVVGLVASLAATVLGIGNICCTLCDEGDRTTLRLESAEGAVCPIGDNTVRVDAEKVAAEVHEDDEGVSRCILTAVGNQVLTIDGQKYQVEDRTRIIVERDEPLRFTGGKATKLE